MAAKDHPGAAKYLPKRKSLPQLRKAVQDCRGCGLHEAATQAVFGAGPADAHLVLVGEQPGDREDKEGAPFVGPAGRLLDQALERADIDPDAVYRTNVVKHFKFSGTKAKRRIHATPDRWEVAACAPWLHAELRAVQAQVIVLLGATAAKSLLGSSFRVTASRGTLLPWPDSSPDHDLWDGAPSGLVLATLHPSAVLRSSERSEALDGLVSDLVVARQGLERFP
jgi:DNA polymerase